MRNTPHQRLKCKPAFFVGNGPDSVKRARVQAPEVFPLKTRPARVLAAIVEWNLFTGRDSLDALTVNKSTIGGERCDISDNIAEG